MTTTSLRRLRILWVDDNGPERFVYELDVLNGECNADVDFVVTVNAARKKLLSSEYDLILLDNHLPGDDLDDSSSENGAKFTEEIRQGLLGSERGWTNASSIPIIICSAFYSEELQRIKAVHGVLTLSKPIDTDILKELVDAVRQKGIAQV